MANEEHEKILRQGVVDWNRWRDENEETMPDLRRANLAAVNLEGANLGATNLRGARTSVGRILKA